MAKRAYYGRQSRPVFSWDRETYTVESLETLIHTANKDDMSAIRAEYTRLRDIAQKRVARLGKSDFAQSQTYKRNMSGFQKLKDMDPRDLPKAMAELAKFVGAKTSTLSGQKETMQKTMETFANQGVNLTPSNYFPVMAAFKELRNRKKVYDSDRVRKVIDTALEKGWDIGSLLASQSFEKLIEHSNQLDQIPERAGTDIDRYVSEVIGW